MGKSQGVANVIRGGIFLDDATLLPAETRIGNATLAHEHAVFGTFQRHFASLHAHLVVTFV